MRWPKAKRVFQWAADDFREPGEKRRRTVISRPLFAALACLNRKHSRRVRSEKRARETTL